MENSVYKLAFHPDMIFDLCVNKTMLLSFERAMTAEDRDWFDLRIAEVKGLIDQKIEFLLVVEPHYTPSELVFALKKRHSLHQSLLPIKIENALVDLMCGLWLKEYLLQENVMGELALEELRSLALRQEQKPSRNYNL